MPRSAAQEETQKEEAAPLKKKGEEVPAVVELERGVIELTEEVVEEEPPKECHLYQFNWKDFLKGITFTPLALCGFPESEDWHARVHIGGTCWEPGMTSCPDCGVPLCMDCLLIANAEE
jgi:hypothetical protein